MQRALVPAKRADEFHVIGGLPIDLGEERLLIRLHRLELGVGVHVFLEVGRAADDPHLVIR